MIEIPLKSWHVKFCLKHFNSPPPPSQLKHCRAADFFTLRGKKGNKYKAPQRSSGGFGLTLIQIKLSFTF